MLNPTLGLRQLIAFQRKELISRECQGSLDQFKKVSRKYNSLVKKLKVFSEFSKNIGEYKGR